MFATSLRPFRTASLLALVVFPMACGLAVIAPTLVEVFYPPAYAGVAPFLMTLAVLGVVRALTSLAGAYLQVAGRTRSFIPIDATLVVTVLGAMLILSRWGAVPASLGVGLGFVASLALTLRALRPEGIAIASVLGAVARPLAVCAPMIAAVVATRSALVVFAVPAPARLFAELAVGALVYTGAALALARPLSRDFLSLVGSLIRRRAATTQQRDRSPRAPPPRETRA